MKGTAFNEEDLKRQRLRQRAWERQILRVTEQVVIYIYIYIYIYG
jgi:hypothetical protein